MNTENLDEFVQSQEDVVPDVYIPHAFSDQILLHIIKNYIPALSPPLILAIQGPMGCGKSWQTRRVCQSNNIHLVSIPGAMLSGEHEKAPVRVLYHAYSRASQEGRQKKKMSVLMIDDFHLSVASTIDGRQYTVNSQLLVGAMMNLADDPEICEQEKVKRTPIIVTGNDFSELYQPLTRHGRMEFFDWRPTIEMKTDILTAAFKPLLRPAELGNLTILLERYPDEDIAFFDSLKNRLTDRLLLDLLKAGKREIVEFRQQVAVSAQCFTIEELLLLAENQRASRPRVYLPSGKDRGGQS